MNIKDVMSHENVDFAGIDPSRFLLGLLSAFDNRFQVVADRAMKEISWKQFFTIVCIDLCRENPSIKELSEILGSSHQNVKQLLLKLEKKGFVTVYADAADKRKQRIALTDYCRDFCRRNDERTTQIMTRMFEGVSPEQLRTTIETVIQIGNNLEEIPESRQSEFGPTGPAEA